MARKTGDQEIVGSNGTYRASTTQLDAMEGLDLTARLMKILVAAGETAFTPASLMKGMAATTPVEVISIAREALKRTVVIAGGQARSLINDRAINDAFDGDTLALIKTVWFALEVNYSGFFPGAGSPAAAPPAAGA